ncbi:MAG TPA: GAF domain-containing SpoIIE family protein phosphatase [Planctomycetota bacterium]|nr:GAF domain-containing SpoIIE family protein phosphatase [Planctomycetota bacterium]
MDDPRAEFARLKKLVEASHALHSTLDLDQLLGLILDAAAHGVGADRGTVFLLDGDELWSRVLSGDKRLEIRLPLGQGIAGSVAKTGETVRIRDAYEDPRFDRSWDAKSGYRTRTVLTAPIRNRAGAIVGVFQLLNKKGGLFDEEDERYLEGLSIHAALAVENARLHASALEKERYDREVKLAQGVQRQLQPERMTLREGGLHVAGMNELCEDATGDYYDVLAPLPEGRIGVAIGDVSGHGLQAALVMAEARAFLRAFAKTAPWLDRALALMNDALVPDMAGGKFLSLFAAIVDPKDGRMEWCNAGHNPPLLCRAGDGSVRALERTGRILGILPGEPCGPGEPLKLEPGDALLLYTDGVTEARGAGGELFGQERLTEALVGAARKEPEAILEEVRGKVRDFTGAGRNDDDVTMVAVKRASDAHC